jgi:hypothetical protein
MRQMLAVVALLALAGVLGCSGVSTVERANLTDPMDRAGYVKSHPGDVHALFVQDGEITRGMSADEVIASWGMPNVYTLSRTEPAENWIYYVRARDSAVLVIYTLTFRADTLATWTIEQRRAIGQTVVSAFEPPTGDSPRSDGDRRKR